MPDKPSPSATIAVLGPDQLGEGPVWDERSGELVRVDISDRRVHRWNPTTDESTSFETEGDVGAIVLCDDGGMVLAIECELWLRDVAGVRFNDCRADPHGRLWAGTLHRDREPRQAALYRLDPGGVLTTVLPDRTISNGIGWSVAGTTMYYIDSTTQRIAEFDYDLHLEPSFPLLDPAKPHRAYWYLKKYGLPFMYWNLMLKGLA